MSLPARGRRDDGAELERLLDRERRRPGLAAAEDLREAEQASLTVGAEGLVAGGAGRRLNWLVGKQRELTSGWPVG